VKACAPTGELALPTVRSKLFVGSESFQIVLCLLRCDGLDSPCRSIRVVRDLHSVPTDTTLLATSFVVSIVQLLAVLVGRAFGSRCVRVMLGNVDKFLREF
jgi:hypothetical protein